MATDKTPTHGERIEDLETQVAKLEKAVKSLEEAIASGDPTAAAMLYAKG